MKKEKTMEYLKNKMSDVISEAQNAEKLLQDKDADLVDIGFALDRLERLVAEAKQTLCDCDEY